MGAGGGAWGAIAQGATQALDAGLTAAFQSKEARKARRWAAEMYQQRYQWTMADMRKAGLNPILAYRQGAGSFPSMGGSPSGPGGRVKGDYAVTAKQMALMNAEESRIRADAWQKNSAAALASEQLYRSKEEQATIRELRPHLVNEAASAARLRHSEALAREFELPLRRADAEYYLTDEGKQLRHLQRIMETAPSWLGGAAAGALLGGGTTAWQSRQRIKQLEEEMRRRRRKPGIGRRRR